MYAAGLLCAYSMTLISDKRAGVGFHAAETGWPLGLRPHYNVCFCLFLCTVDALEPVCINVDYYYCFLAITLILSIYNKEPSPLDFFFRPELILFGLLCCTCWDESTLTLV